MAQRPRGGRRKSPRRDSTVVSAKKLGGILVKDGVITEEQMLEAFNYQNAHGGSMKDAVLKLGLATEEDLIGAVIGNLDVSYISLAGYQIKPEALEVLSPEYCYRNALIPVSLAKKTLTVVMVDPLDMEVIHSLRAESGCTVVPAIAREQEITDALERSYGPPASPKGQGVSAELPSEQDAEAEVAREYAEQRASAERVDIEEGVNEQSAPIIRLSTQIVEEAYEKRSSDIHIEPFETETIVRYRVDGVMHIQKRLPPAAIRALLSRYKIMSGLDIAEHRMPQDGRIKFKTFSRKGYDIDLRVSIIPVAFGEKVVMRILDKQSTVQGLDTMGFSAENLATYRKMIRMPYGMILHVGPTGSGKTTTLYAALTEINKPELNIQTAEDPVEYMLKGVNQSQMHHDIGYDFKRALRAFLRQDPDVVMVGEVRDLETASIAVEAALTGHLLFSTLHTNDSVGTIVRMVEMGLEPFLVSSSLLLVCAQRLMRRLCDCKVKAEPSESEQRALLTCGFDPDDLALYATGGCDNCGNTGYRGRTGTHEVLTMSPELHELVNKRAGDEDLHEAAIRAGMVPIFQDAMAKVAAGTTSFEEAVRVVREK